MKKFLIVGVVALMSALQALPASATKGTPEHKVTLCHATHSETNPFVAITVDVASAKFRAHDAHQDNEDIIPAFTVADGYPFDYPGKNLDNGGQEFLDNGCASTSPSPSPSESESPSPSPSESESPSPSESPRGNPHPSKSSLIPPTSATRNPSPTAFTGAGDNAVAAGVAGGALLLLGFGALSLRKFATK